MNNEDKILLMLETLTNTVTEIKSELSTVNQRLDKLEQGQTKLEQGQKEIKEQQMKDSRLLQSVFDQTIKLTEYQNQTDAKFDKIKSVL